MELAALPPGAALLAAVAVGAASFLSPCVAPLLPGYLAFLAGSGAATEAPPTTGTGTGTLVRARTAVLPRAAGFVTGFVVLFALLGASAATLSRQLTGHRAELELVSGLVVALLGLAMAFDRTLLPVGASAALQRSSSSLGAPTSALAAVPVGAAFAAAWSPCIGPTLAGILALAAGTADPAWGATLLVAYGIGLGLPFLAAALALDRVHALSAPLRRHAGAIRRVSGALLVLLGVAIATGGFGQVTAHLARLAPRWLA